MTPAQWEALQDSVVDGYMFYLNAIERDVNNDVYRLLSASGAEIISLRTLGRVFVDYASWNSETTPVPAYTHPELPRRVDALKSIYERCGCRDWVEFNMAFRRALPNVVATIGMTTKPAHLHRYLEADQQVRPMAAALAEEICALQAEWYA